MQKHLRPGSFQLSIHIRAHFDCLSGGFQKKSPTRWSLEHCRVFFYFKDIKLCSFVNVPDKERVKRIWEHTCTVLVLRMAHRKGKEIKQQPSMLPVLGCAWLLLSFFQYPVGHPEHEHCIGVLCTPKEVQYF